MLSVNVNKIALLRNSRVGKGPDVMHFARIALEAGAAGITVHPRPDERHITYRDATDLAGLLAESRWTDREYNIEGNPFEGEWLPLVIRVKPDQATLVPDSITQSTSDHGFDLPADVERLKPVVAQLKEAGCRVSIFLDPIPSAMAPAVETGTDRIELYTESFAEAFAHRDQQPQRYESVCRAFADSARAAVDAGLGVNAGHDLNLQNLGAFLETVGRDRLLEVSIGHALVGDALEFGLAGAVERYLHILQGR